MTQISQVFRPVDSFSRLWNILEVSWSDIVDEVQITPIGANWSSLILIHTVCLYTYISQ